ncbi:MAG: hypothetical protein E7A55_14845 [Clostridium perfringens]|nr:hypothetical protein [Clostridium perfringens]
MSDLDMLKRVHYATCDIHAAIELIHGVEFSPDKPAVMILEEAQQAHELLLESLGYLIEIASAIGRKND